jgi:CheY-like chemotaxis protein
MMRTEMAITGSRWEGAPLSLIIADGDDDFRRLVRGCLGPAVRVVGDARDGEEAVSLARWLHPDVVLMDMAMPGVTGPEAARRIKADHADTTVVLLISVEQEQQLDVELSSAAVAALRVGADALIRKRHVRSDVMALRGRSRPRRGRR